MHRPDGSQDEMREVAHVLPVSHLDSFSKGTIELKDIVLLSSPSSTLGLFATTARRGNTAGAER